MLKKGDLVSRIKYNHDIIFEIKKLVKSRSGAINAILCSKTTRLIASAPLEDLIKVSRERLEQVLQEEQESIIRTLPIFTRENPEVIEVEFKKN